MVLEEIIVGWNPPKSYAYAVLDEEWVALRCLGGLGKASASAPSGGVIERNPCADINFDGTVDVSDLVVLLFNWGPC